MKHILKLALAVITQLNKPVHKAVIHTNGVYRAASLLVRLDNWLNSLRQAIGRSIAKRSQGSKWTNGRWGSGKWQ